jgi:Fe-S-cluster containining protein
MNHLGTLPSKASEKRKEHRALLEKGAKKMPLNKLWQAHKDAFSRIDCLECANCCKTLGPRFTSSDISRIAKKMRMKDTEFTEKFLRVDEDEDYVAKSLPCPFLGEDNRCSVYEDRPGDCRKYPYTDSEAFFKYPKTTLKNAAYCPAVFHVLEKLKDI